MRIKETDSVERFELSHSCFMWLGEWAKRLGTTIHLGSVPLVVNGRLYNSSVWIGEDGVAQAGYQKIHLFDIELQGQKPYRESSVFDRGTAGRLVDFKGWKIGESICYDVRFSELYSAYAYAQADLLLIPAAFLVETGKVHWEVLLRARAIESQCYVIASAQVGSHQSTKGKAERNTYGHSMVIDPWGLVQADLGGLHSAPYFNRIALEGIAMGRKQTPFIGLFESEFPGMG
jgi:predicted amidohydrolase